MATKKKRSPTNFVRDKIHQGTDGSADHANVRIIQAVARTPYEETPFVVVFPAVMHGGKPFVLDLQFLMPLTKIGRALFDGHLRKLGSRPNFKTATNYTKRLRNGIVEFLNSEGLLEIGLDKFCSDIIPHFETWLNQQKDGVSRWSESTRAENYLYVKTVFEKIASDSHWKSSIPQRPRFKSNPWPHRTRSVKKKEILDDDLATRIRVASIDEIVDLVRRRGEIQRIIEEDEVDSNSKKNDGYHTLRRDREYEKIVLDIYREILKSPTIHSDCFPDTYRYILSKYNTTISEIRGLIFPRPEGLVPFVLLMALALSYNASTVLDARLGDFTVVRELSSYLVFFNDEPQPDDENESGDAPEAVDDDIEADLLANAFKPRSHKRQPVYIPIDNEPDNPYFMYGYLLNWTSNLRSFSYFGVSDKLFIFSTPKSKNGISSFTGLDGTATPQGWADALRRFRERHDLEHFTLDMLRPTSLDVTFEEFNGDIRLASIQGNHTHIDTTSRSYRSDAEKKRQYERLGAVHSRRDRWRKTDGKIDPRDHPEEFDVDCATPGWTCADPYDSPYTTKGELCEGYGRCPACPLGGVNLNSPLSCAYTLGLLEAIDNAQRSLDPKTWLQRWLPVKQRLVEKWIPSFSERAIREAKQVDIPPMPRPE
ncbi:hypothetical protein [Paraburkholderia kirstenboschensis]|uniref:Uncharacterized protein n=1 Tax=Paraburkholderia kirstenboschensis TaxID=1245436 RepID=A0ABZ0EIA9_9BURK|nr:hypothetical protein [Paraburkholderia kirstenboschensis]WOD16954.1 hypothetical protein RW095_13910 [Paraburkholderia kirstenboschensis]